jgi:hypothetical protein
MSNLGDSTGPSVEGVLNYVAPDTPFSRRFSFPGGETNTGRFVPHRVTIENARIAAERPTLDSHGFELFRRRSAIRDFHDRAEIEARYPGEVMETVKTLTGADLVLSLGFVMRMAGDTSDGRNQPPAADVHVDISPATGPRTARPLLAGAAPGKTYRRALITSFWRPFSEPPQDWPLALCDHRSIAAEEGVPNRRIKRDHPPTPEELLTPIPGEDDMPAALVFRHGPHHRWYYFPDMDRDEAVMIKLYDSDRGRAWFAPHTAFRDETRLGAHTRESIEFRTVAYWLYPTGYNA